MVCQNFHNLDVKAKKSIIDSVSENRLSLNTSNDFSVIVDASFANSARALNGPGGTLLNGCFLRGNNFANSMDNTKFSNSNNQVKLLIANYGIYAVSNAFFDIISEHQNQNFQGLKWMLMFPMVGQASLNTTLFHGMLNNFFDATGIKKENTKLRTVARVGSGVVLLSLPVISKLILHRTELDYKKNPIPYYLLYSANDLFGPYATYPFIFGKAIHNLSKNFIFDEENQQSCIAKSAGEKIRLALYGAGTCVLSAGSYFAYRLVSYYLKSSGFGGDIASFFIAETVLSCASITETMFVFKFLEWTLNSIPYYQFDETKNYEPGDKKDLEKMLNRYKTLKTASLAVSVLFLGIKIYAYCVGGGIAFSAISTFVMNPICSITAICSRKINVIENALKGIENFERNFAEFQEKLRSNPNMNDNELANLINSNEGYQEIFWRAHELWQTQQQQNNENDVEDDDLIRHVPRSNLNLNRNWESCPNLPQV